VAAAGLEILQGYLMQRLALALLLSVVACHPLRASGLSESQRDVKHAGSVLRFALPAGALLAAVTLPPRTDADESSPWLMGGTRTHDLLLALARSEVVTRTLKLAVHEERPDGGKHSFPSGHTSMAFAGAEFIRKEMGWSWGAPALGVAAFVGWSRVESRRHYTHDVLAGAAIGVLANHDFWRQRTPAGELAIAPSLLIGARQAVAGLRFELLPASRP
jgi:hypothetical protein